MINYSLILLASVFMLGACNLRTLIANIPSYDSFVYAIQWGSKFTTSINPLNR